MKEAYHIVVMHDNLLKEGIWEKIWTQNLWPKVSTFLWLVSQRNILTWDYICKCGYEGPSICVLCYKEEETNEHLLGSFSFEMTLWDTGDVTFKQSNHDGTSVISTIEK